MQISVEVLERKKNTVALEAASGKGERRSQGEGREGDSFPPHPDSILREAFWTAGCISCTWMCALKRGSLLSDPQRSSSGVDDPIPEMTKERLLTETIAVRVAQGALALGGKHRAYLFWKNCSSSQIHQSVQLNSNTLSPMACFYIQCWELQISKWNFPWMKHQVIWCSKQGLQK